MKTLLLISILLLTGATYAQSFQEDCDCYKKRIQDAESWSINRRERGQEIMMRSWKLCLIAQGRNEEFKRVEQFERIGRFIDGKTIAETVWGKVLIDTSYKVLRSLPQNYLEYIGRNSFILEKNEKDGVSDLNGKEIVPAAYDYILPLYAENGTVGQLACKTPGQLSIVTITGTPIKTFDGISRAHVYNGYLLHLENMNEESVFLNASLTELVPATRNKRIDQYYKDLILIGAHSLGKTYVLTKKGEIVRVLEGGSTDRPESPDNPYSLFKGSTYSLYNASNNTLTDIGKYHFAYLNSTYIYLSDGAGHSGAADLAGKLILPVEFKHFEPLTKDWFLVVKNDAEYYYNIKTKEQHLKPKDFAGAKALSVKLSNGLDFSSYPFFYDHKEHNRDTKVSTYYNFNHTDGQKMPGFAKTTLRSSLTGNVISVEKGKCSIRNASDSIIAVFDAESVSPLENSSHYLFSLNGRYGVISGKGEQMLPAVYESVTGTSNVSGLFIATLNGKKGAVSINNREVLPFNYEMLSLTEDDFLARTGNEEPGTAISVPFLKDFLFTQETGRLTPLKSATGNFCSFQKEGKYGIYDFDQRKIIVEAKYNHVSVSGNNFRISDETSEKLIDAKGKVIKSAKKQF